VQPDIAVFRELEESLLRPEVRRSPKLLARLIADDFVEFGSSGRVFGKADVLASAGILPDVVIPLADFAIQVHSPDLVHVTYRSTTRLPGGAAVEALRSSQWVRRDDRWQLAFHQGTKVAPRVAWGKASHAEMPR